MNKREYLANLQSLSNKSKINEFSLADAMGLIGIGNSPTDPSDKINKRKKELEAKGAPTSFEAPTPNTEPTTSVNTSKTASDGGVINVAGAKGDGESNQKALKAGLDNINRQRQAGEISAKDAADYRAQLSDRAGAAIGEVEQQEKESAVEKGLDRVADVAEFIPGAGQGVAALHAASYGVRAAMYGDEDGKYAKGALQSGINAVLPSVLGAAGKVATKGLGLAAAGAGKVAPTAVGKVAQAATAVGEKLAGAGTSVGGAVERAAEKVIGTNATALGAAALKAPGNAVGSMAGAYGGYEAAKEADLGLVGTAAAVIGGGIVGGKAANLGNQVPGLGRVIPDIEGSVARNLGRVVGGAARGVNDAAGKIPMPSMPSMPSLPAGVRNKIGAVAVAASQLLPAGGAQAASRIAVPQAGTAISAVERGVVNAERVSVAERLPERVPERAPETAPRATEKVPERAPENAPTSSERAPERAPERASASSDIQAKVEANAKQTLINNSKAAETNPTIDTAPAPTKAPATDKVPAADKAPVADKAPAADEAPARNPVADKEPVREPVRETKPSKSTKTTTGKTPVATPSSELSGEPVVGADDSFAGRQFGYDRTNFNKVTGVVGDSTRRSINSTPPSPPTRKLIPRPQLENFNMKKTIKDKIKAKLNSAKNIGKDGY
jgi:hypothetical protein